MCIRDSPYPNTLLNSFFLLISSSISWLSVFSSWAKTSWLEIIKNPKQKKIISNFRIPQVLDKCTKFLLIFKTKRILEKETIISVENRCKLNCALTFFECFLHQNHMLTLLKKLKKLILEVWQWIYYEDRLQNLPKYNIDMTKFSLWIKAKNHYSKNKKCEFSNLYFDMNYSVFT